MSKRRNILCDDPEYFAIKDGLNRRKKELNEAGLPASFSGTGLVLHRAFHAGRIPVSLLVGCNKEVKPVKIGRKK